MVRSGEVPEKRRGMSLIPSVTHTWEVQGTEKAGDSTDIPPPSSQSGA